MTPTCPSAVSLMALLAPAATASEVVRRLEFPGQHWHRRDVCGAGNFRRNHKQGNHKQGFHSLPPNRLRQVLSLLQGT
jgi:hypothetical protein